MDSAWAKLQYTARRKDSHKGDYGQVLIIGGCPGMLGAVRLAGEAALRVGAGAVTIATHPEHAYLIQLTRPELMSAVINTADDLEKLLKKISVIIFGPGLGQVKWSQDLWEIFKKIIKFKIPLILDGDGLNFLAKDSQYSDNWILTPHPGEAARLLGVSISEIQQQRQQAVFKLQEKFGGVCVLKGAGSLIINPQKIIDICNYGNPGMATAGTGDVLTGVIGGYLAQSLDKFTAAKLGVLIHAEAGDLAAQKFGEDSLIASDLINCLPEVILKYAR